MAFKYIFLSLSTFRYMHLSIIAYMIWKVLPPDDGTVCSLCQLKGQASWYCSVRREKWVWRIRWRGQGEERFLNMCFFHSGSVCTYPGSASGSQSIHSAPSFPVSNYDCTKPTLSWQNVFCLKTSLYFVSKKPRENSLKTFWTKTHSRNSPESLRLFSFDYCGYATLGGTARRVDGVPLYPTSDIL